MRTRRKQQNTEPEWAEVERGAVELLEEWRAMGIPEGPKTTEEFLPMLREAYRRKGDPRADDDKHWRDLKKWFDYAERQMQREVERTERQMRARRTPRTHH